MNTYDEGTKKSVQRTTEDEYPMMFPVNSMHASAPLYIM